VKVSSTRTAYAYQAPFSPSRRRAGAVGTEAGLPRARAGASFGEIRHTITHHRYTLVVKEATSRAAGKRFRWFDPAQLGEIPLSTTARKALKLAGIAGRMEKL